MGHDFDGEETLSSLYWVRVPDVLLEISDLWCHRNASQYPSCRTVWLHNIVYDPPTERSSSGISKLLRSSARDLLSDGLMVKLMHYVSIKLTEILKQMHDLLSS